MMILLISTSEVLKLHVPKWMADGIHGEKLVISQTLGSIAWRIQYISARIKNLTTQSVVHETVAWALPGNLLEMQNIRPDLAPPESEPAF